MDSATLVLVGLGIGVVIAALGFLALRRKGISAPVEMVAVETIAERVRAVGKLVGLEVHAKEIATSTKGWGWIPPILLSQAKVAMIFSFEKQYFVDLHRIHAESVEEVSPGHYRLRMPEVEGTLRLCDVSPYDIQAGRILGLLDVIQMNAETQRQLIRAAQEQAAQLFERNESRYLTEARRAIGTQLQTFLGMFDVRLDVDWGGDAGRVRTGEMVVEREMERKMAGVG
jgi:hypothetical protein